MMHVSRDLDEVLVEAEAEAEAEFPSSKSLVCVQE